jgi:tetratricopeptide (TPR) repeat protein
MSRLYLVLLLSCAFQGFGQAKLKQYLDFADKQIEKGDLIYAISYYEKAMEIDSTSVSTLWKFALAQEAYKNYGKAAYYFKKVYDKESGKLYPASILKHALMLKQDGRYKEALEIFKFCKKKYTNKSDYNYKKSKRELESILWAIQMQKDSLSIQISPLSDAVNTKNSEFGHSIRNNVLYFSSLQADEITDDEEVVSSVYKTKIYTSNLNDKIYEKSKILEAYAYENLNSGNGSFNQQGTQFYFSICGESAYNYRCKIAVASINEKGKIVTIDTLGDIINVPNANTTMPHFSILKGKEVLFFVSDRSGGEGGLDIYFSEIKNGQQFGKVSPIKLINTIDNEISPFWNETENRLYFSSSWHNGFGGQDVHFVSFKNGNFETVTNAGKPINSAANDLYYFVHNDSSFVTSNRVGVQYSKNPTCCSDIFVLYSPMIDSITPPIEVLSDLLKRLPLALYFHNDEPTPKVLDTTTILSYTESYTAYTAMLDQYKIEYSKGLNTEKANDAKEDIEGFFLEYVDFGFSNLQLFTKALLVELEKGSKINITVKGFASPLAKTDYNVNLTKRRISSLRNELQRYQNGVMTDYLNGTAINGGQVIITEEPFGENKANQLISDNPNDTKNSVYSRGAAIERKIEIIGVNLIEKKL